MLGLDNEKSIIRLGIQGTKSGETTTLEKKTLSKITPIFNFKKKTYLKKVIIHR